MKYGMNLLLWTTEVRAEHFPLLEKIKVWGFDGAELPVFSFDRQQAQAVRRKLDELGLSCTVVTVVPEDKNPISPDPAVRGAAVEHLKQAIDICHLLGAEVLCGPYVSPVGKLVGRGRTVEEWRWAVETFQKVAPYAQQAGVLLALEYLNRFETYFANCAEDLARLVDEVAHPSFRMMYDTFHANIEEKKIAPAIRQAGRRIAHVHISENDRSTPGEGHVAWDETFSALREIGYDGWLVIEAFGQALPELAAATCIWRRMFPSEEHVAVEGLRFVRSMVQRYWGS
jgi:D-psicose/D-tagatose/L-ribulose 3-epimerase